MRLSRISIENFRSFKSETINLDKYNCFVGANGSGKSTVLMALNVFFRTNTPNTNLFALTEEDFHHKDKSTPIKITLTFEDLPPEAQEDFKQYYRQNKLVVFACAEWDASTQTAPVKQYGGRLAMSDFAIFFAKYNDGAKAAELKEVYTSIRQKYPDLAAPGSKDAMHEALRSYEEAHPELCVLKDSSDEFYGFTKGADRLPKYIQWIYIPAVKDAATEQNEEKKTALGELLARTTRTVVNFKDRIQTLKKEVEEKYKELIESERSALSGLSESLQSRLRAWSHPGAMVNVNWHYDKDRVVSVTEPYARAAIGEDKFIGEISRLGHGIQRAFLVALLQELAHANDTTAPTLILGFEEPELYLHPPQGRYVASLLEELSEKNSQIILTTHSPYFVPSKGFENVRLVRKDTANFYSKATEVNLKDITELLASALGESPRPPSQLVADIEQIMQPSLKELFFSPVAVLVEGREDVAFISTYFHLSGLWHDFRKFGCHFVVCEGKTNLSRPLAIAQQFGIPVFSIFDGDKDAKDEEKNNNVRDNKCILNLSGLKEFDPSAAETIWAENVVMWSSTIGAAVKESYGATAWDAAKIKAQEANGWQGVNRKNSLLIAATLEELWGQGKRSAALERVCNQIINFAKEQSGEKDIADGVPAESFVKSKSSSDDIKVRK